MQSIRLLRCGGAASIHLEIAHFLPAALMSLNRFAVVAALSALLAAPLHAAPAAPAALASSPAADAVLAPVSAALEAADDSGAEAESKDLLRSERKLFPKPKVLEGNVTFWKRVFAEFSENQSVVHDIRSPNRVYTVLDFQSDAAELSRAQLSGLKASEETSGKARMIALLRSTAAIAATPDAMNPEQRRIAALFANDPGALQNAADYVRVQRGLKERTREALVISGQYLPEMERIFADTGVPRLMTRLPFVESSFNIQAYSKVAAAGLWQFMPSSAKMYMRYNSIGDERRDPWASTQAAAQHLRDDYNYLQNWPLAVTAYNYGRGGLAKALRETNSTTLDELLVRYDGPRFGFASRNFYSEFLAATEVERDWRKHFGDVQRLPQIKFDTITLDRYTPYHTLVRVSGGDEDRFQTLNPSYSNEVQKGRLYVPAGDRIRIPAGQAKAFNAAYSRLGNSETFSHQRVQFFTHVVRKGETLAGIASHYGVSEATLRSINRIRKGKLKKGRALRVPNTGDEAPVQVAEVDPVGSKADADEEDAKPKASAKSGKKIRPGKASGRAKTVKTHSHKVKPGQTLSGIAEKYGVSMAAIKKANKLGKSGDIRIGMQLKIPS
jgi:membrane-bound lytic murein transglycosylase D